MVYGGDQIVEGVDESLLIDFCVFNDEFGLGGGCYVLESLIGGCIAYLLGCRAGLILRRIV